MNQISEMLACGTERPNAYRLTPEYLSLEGYVQTHTELLGDLFYDKVHQRACASNATAAQAWKRDKLIFAHMARHALPLTPEVLEKFPCLRALARKRAVPSENRRRAQERSLERRDAELVDAGQRVRAAMEGTHKD